MTTRPRRYSRRHDWTRADLRRREVTQHSLSLCAGCLRLRLYAADPRDFDAVRVCSDCGYRLPCINVPFGGAINASRFQVAI